MQRLQLVLLTLILFICGITSVTSFAQVSHSFCATDQACSWGALNTFSTGISLPSLPNGCLSTTSGLVNSQACGLPLTGGTLTGLLNGTIFTASTVITAPQFCIGNSCITAWPASSAPAGTNSLQYSNGAGTALLALPNASAGSWLASTSATTAPAMQTKPVLDARDFGTPNGSNAGDLIQAAINSSLCGASTGCVIDARGFGATDTIAGLSITKPVNLILGATNFSVTSTISVNTVTAPVIQGSAIGVTTLTWAGNNSTPMFDLNSSNAGTFHDFLMIAPSGHPLSACFTAEQGAAGVSTDNTFTNIVCAGSIVDGFHWQVGAGGDGNNDRFTFNNVTFQTYSHACFNNDGSTQSQLHVLNQVNCKSYGSGQYGWYGQGSFAAHDVFMSNNTVCDYQITYPNTGVTIDGAGFSITTNRFFCDSPVGSPTPVTIQGQQFQCGASDGKVINIGGGGPYLIEQNYVYDANTIPCQFYYNPAGVPNARSIGNTIGTSLTNPLTCYGGGSVCWESLGDTYIAGGFAAAETRLPTNIFGPLNLGYSSGPYGISGGINFIGSNSGSSIFSLLLNGAGTSLALGANAFVNSAGLFGMTAINMPGCGVGQYPAAWGVGCVSIPQPWTPSGVFNVASGTAGSGAFSNPASLNTTGATLLVGVCIGFSTNCTVADSLGNTFHYLTGCTNSAGPSPTRIFYAYGITTGPDAFTIAGGTSGENNGVIYAFNTGGVTDSSVYDVSTCTAGIGTPPYQTASGVTPTAGDIVVAGLGAWGTLTSLSIAGSGADVNYSTPLDVPFGVSGWVGASYLLGASGSALNPVWTAAYSGPNPYPIPLLAAFKTTASPLLVSTTPIQAPNTPQVGTPSVNQAACIKSAGPPVVIGYCSTVVGSGGACTCN